MLIKSEGCFEKDLLYLTLLAILKVNGANLLLVLEENWSCGKMFLLLTKYHYWLDNITLTRRTEKRVKNMHFPCKGTLFLLF